MLAKIFKIISNLILAFVLCVGVLVVLSFSNVPRGFRMLTVMSGSMKPTLQTGSVIFVKTMPDYAIGDIVTRATSDPKVTITHRIVSKNEVDGQTKFETKGDANNSTDGEKFTQDKIIGKELLTIPYFGYVVSFAKTQQGILLLIIIPSVIIIYEEIRKIINELRRIKKQKIEKRGTFNFETKTQPQNVHPRPKKII